jgi:hypothetical protein
MIDDTPGVSLLFFGIAIPGGSKLATKQSESYEDLL